MIALLLAAAVAAAPAVSDPAHPPPSDPQSRKSAVDKSVHALREQTERDVRARLGPDRWARAYAAGRRASIDALLKDIDRVAAKS